MIRTMAITQDYKILNNPPLSKLNQQDILWYWMDFQSPTVEEVSILERHFNFHPLAIEDCLHYLQRPKLEYYGDYNFFVTLTMKATTLELMEVDLFVGCKYVVSYHHGESSEINSAWNKLLENPNHAPEGAVQVAYLIMDKIVDNYFPIIYKLEDMVDELEMEKGISSKKLMERVFDIRSDLMRVRRTINSMSDLLYRILNSSHLEDFKPQRMYFSDIYDHLLKLSEMIDSNLDITADLRDSYLALNADRMNSIMMVLTVITSVFIPLTFIAGIYGMNFTYMPELEWRYGYFLSLGVMLLIAISMLYWFKRKGWIDFNK